jgi:hypothetical protein
MPTEQIVKNGFYKRGATYVKCQLVAGPYTFRNAVKLAIEGQDKLILTTADMFVETKPLTEFQKERADKKLEKQELRVVTVASLMAAIPKDGSKMSVSEIAAKSGIKYPWGKLNYWDEFGAFAAVTEKRKCWFYKII